MKIALGADHGGFELKEKVKTHLIENGYEVLDLGTNSNDSVDYPEFGHAVGHAVAEKKAEFGIVIGIRAALCTNTTMARLTREHNNANILAMGGRIVGDVLALEMVDVFLATKFQGGRHEKRINKIETI